MSGNQKKVRLQELAAQEGLREFFDSLAPKTPQDTLREVFDSLAVGPAIHIADDEPVLNAAEIREATLAALATSGLKNNKAETIAAGDELREPPEGPAAMVMEMLQDIVTQFYCPLDPDPEAEFEHINPIIDISGPDWGPYEITLYPFTHDKMKEDGELKIEDIDADLHDGLTQFYGDISELPHKKIKLKVAYPAFKIICDTPVRLLQMLKELAAEHQYPSLDTVHMAALQPDEKEFFEDEGEWKAYDTERQRNFTNRESCGFFNNHALEFMDAIPARPFNSRAEAAATSLKFHGIYVLPYSFIQLESLLMKAQGHKNAPESNPLLGYH